MTALEVSEAEIGVHWQEEGYYHPLATFIAHANLTDAAVQKRFSLENFPECFKGVGEHEAPASDAGVPKEKRQW